MARLIDADTLVDKFWQEECRTQTRRDFVAMVNYAPTVDAVEVVRCKDCVSFDEQFRTVIDETGKAYCGGYCYHWEYESGMSPNRVGGDDFCSYGERKDGDGNG